MTKTLYKNLIIQFWAEFGVFFVVKDKISSLSLVCVFVTQKKTNKDSKRERERDGFVWKWGKWREEKGNIGDLTFFLVWSALNY